MNKRKAIEMLEGWVVKLPCADVVGLDVIKRAINQIDTSDSKIDEAIRTVEAWDRSISSPTDGWKMPLAKTLTMLRSLKDTKQKESKERGRVCAKCGHLLHSTEPITWTCTDCEQEEDKLGEAQKKLEAIADIRWTNVMGEGNFSGMSCRESYFKGIYDAQDILNSLKDTKQEERPPELPKQQCSFCGKWWLFGSRCSCEQEEKPSIPRFYGITLLEKALNDQGPRIAVLEKRVKELEEVHARTHCHTTRPLMLQEMIEKLDNRLTELEKRKKRGKR